ncbi:MAG: diacylglycerol/lipid kinase family protein [Thermoplasmatota archaeon]
MRHLLIFNPTARSGRCLGDLHYIRKEFGKRGIEHHLKSTRGKDHAIEIAYHGTISGDNDVLIALGGDGTICEVITGIMRAIENGAPPVKMGVVHIGTSPDFNRYHGIPTDVLGQMDVIEKGATRWVDVGRVRYRSLDGSDVTSYFGSSVNLGLGSDIASRSNSRYRRFLGDTLGTLLSTLVSLANYKTSDLEAVIDGEVIRFTDLVNLTVGKDPHIASGMRVPIEMQEDSGEMYCLSVGSDSKLSLLVNLWRMYRGNILDYDGARLVYCRELMAGPNVNDKVEFDGDHRGSLPVRVDLVPRGLEVICGGR